MKPPKKIGVYIGVPGLGDFLFIVPLFRALKQQWPEAETVYIGEIQRKFIMPVLEACPYVDRYLQKNFYEDMTLSGCSKFTAAIRAEKFDLIVDTQRKLMPSMLLSMSGAGAIVGHSSRGIFSDFKVDISNKSKMHTADISLALARALGIENPSVELEITTLESNRKYADAFYSSSGLGGDSRIAGIIPNAGFPIRQWTSKKFAELSDRLAKELGYAVILFGAAADMPVIEEIKTLASTDLIVEEQGDKTILDSAALMARCSVIVGVDSGPLHVADATGVPCVGIYGPTFPERFGLLGRNSRHVCLYAECAPCKNPGCGNRVCIEAITVDSVFQEVVSLVASSASAK